jgi:hypothetical protein
MKTSVKVRNKKIVTLYVFSLSEKKTNILKVMDEIYNLQKTFASV